MSTVQHEITGQSAELLEAITYRLLPSTQARFDLLVTRRRSDKITSDELAELRTLNSQSEMQAAQRVRAVMGLAQQCGVSFDEMLCRLGM